jgi:TolB-like protein/class 3 adenylate cyclase/Flp pilus assembly protein TadD
VTRGPKQLSYPRLRQPKLAGEIDRVHLTNPDILTPPLMSAEPVMRGFDIGYVLFIDIVGYSRLSGEEQKRVVRQLNETVRATPEFQRADAAGQLLRLPAGDGMALVFSASPEAPVQCALEISRALKEQPHMPVRMGVNSGPIDQIEDVNDRSNVSGAGINMAQRVMSCGDAGHILVAKRVADDLAQYEKWRPCLRELGEVEVKHGVKIDLVNLCLNGIGNSELPERVKESRRCQTVARRKRVALGGALLLIASLLAWAVYYQAQQRKTALAAIPQKSIAVLPFKNLSADPDNAYFADGVQEEILTDLSRIADLKVISRTSVMQYGAGTARNVRAIGAALGVAHLLEGSVQRVGNKVRVIAQLIDSRSDTHLWAQTYDRDLADVFAIQSEIAETIARQLQTRLAPAEKAAIESPPTRDLAAYDLFIRAQSLAADMTNQIVAKEKLPKAIDLLNEAVARDGKFIRAYCLLSRIHGQLYFTGLDHTAERLALARQAAEAALQIDPEDGEAHLAMADYYYHGFRNYTQALRELSAARQTLPNSSQVFEWTAYIARRQGDWKSATSNFERAVNLDPRNFQLLQQLALTYQGQHRYQDQLQALDRALTIVPEDLSTLVLRAWVPADWRADLRPFNAFVAEYTAKDPSAAGELEDINFALCERTPEAIERTLKAYPAEGAVYNGIKYPRAYWEGVVARWRGEKEKASLAFAEAKRQIEEVAAKQPDFPAALSLLGLIDAGLGRKEDALREARRACELLPIHADAIDGVAYAANLAQVYTWTGEKDLAVDQLENVERVPNFVSYGYLKLQPLWDPLRGDPRFEKLVASLAPKD